MDAAEIIQRTDKLMQDRQPYESLWSDVRDYLYPDGPSGNLQDVKGQENRDRIVSNFGEVTLDEAAADLAAMSANPATVWKSLKALDPEDEKDYAVRVALEQANLRMLSVYAAAASRFEVAYPQALREFLAYGTAIIYLADRPGQIPLFSPRSVVSCAFSEDENDEVDELVWQVKYAAKKAFEKWGKAVGEKVMKAATDPARCMDEFTFRHYVLPRRIYDIGKRDARARPFAEFWVCEDDAEIIAEGGFFEFPYTVFRTGQKPGEYYGRGRGAKALAETKMHQRVRRSQIQGAEKTINPPLQGPDDGIMGQVNLRPGAMNYIRAEYWLAGRQGIAPIMTGARVELGEEFGASVKAEIQSALMRAMFKLPREPRMPTAHVLALEEENLRATAPIIGVLQSECLGPLDNRLYHMMKRDGAFDDVFQNVQVAFRTEFQSPAARAMRLGHARAFAQRLEMFMPLFQSQPELIALTDWATAYRDIGDIMGVPAHYDTPPEDFKQQQAATQAAMKQKQQLEAGKDMTTMAKNVAPVIEAVAEQQAQAAAPEQAAA